MARPESNTVSYFPFYCEDGEKMFYLEETYGNDGFATFVKLLRELARVENHYLNLSKNTTIMFLSAKCKVSKETLKAIINDLVELGKFDRVLWEENSIIWCQDFIDSIQDAYSKRKSKCITYQGLLLHLQSLGVRKHNKQTNITPINTQSKVKEIKEEDKELNKNNNKVELNNKNYFSNFTPPNYLQVEEQFFRLYRGKYSDDRIKKSAKTFHDHYSGLDWMYGKSRIVNFIPWVSKWSMEEKNGQTKEQEFIKTTLKTL